MDRKDKIRIIYLNLKAGRPMVCKLVIGMSFLVTLLFCSLSVIYSYFCYMREFEKKYIADCYYYENIDTSEVTGAWIGNLLSDAEEKRMAYCAEQEIILLPIELNGEDRGLTAGETNIVIDKKTHRIDDYYIYNRKAYQNIYDSNSYIEMALYQKGITVIPKTITPAYDKEAIWVVGRFPENSGEIMLDTYILKLYGIEENYSDIIGKNITIAQKTANGETVILQEYEISGVLQAEYLMKRESLDETDIHFEHIFINLRDSDMDQFRVVGGTVRYYFDNYMDYIHNYEKSDELLRLNLEQIYAEMDTNIKLTGNGIQYSLLNWLMNYVGKILIVLIAIFCIVDMFSTGYILEFYRKRNEKYLSMLEVMGMVREDRKQIFAGEVSVIMFLATMLGCYASVVILLIMNSFVRQILDFSLVVNVIPVGAAIGISWICFGIIVMINNKSRSI